MLSLENQNIGKGVLVTRCFTINW